MNSVVQSLVHVNQLKVNGERTAASLLKNSSGIGVLAFFAEPLAGLLLSSSTVMSSRLVTGVALL